MSVFELKDLSHEDATKMGFGEQYLEDRPVGVFTPGKATAGTNAQWAQQAEDQSVQGLYRLVRDRRFAASRGDRRRLAALYAASQDKVAARIMELPAAERLDAVRRWKELTGEPCPRGITLS
jgi:hypothetical protein